jgi:glycosyltransferase involved in cell wall biosynthesis
VNKLKVAIDLRLAGYRSGGIARYATELADALALRDDMSLFQLRSARDTLSGPQFRKLRTPPHHRLERYAVAAELLVGRMRPEVYHATDFIAPRIPGTATVATVHDLEFVRHPEYLDDASLRYYRQIERSRDWTNAWITPSRWTAEDLASTYEIDPATITVIPHGLPVHLAHKQPVPRDQREPHLLIVGTIEPRKRHALILDALELIGDPLDIVLIGSIGWQSDDLVSRISRTAGIAWRRAVDDSALWDAYRNAWAVLVPSKSEGFGLQALEAMASGTPVVSSGHGALQEVTGLAALVPDSDDPSGWAAAIERIRKDEHLWNELSVFGQRRARTFTWTQAAEATARVYRTAAAG